MVMTGGNRVGVKLVESRVAVDGPGSVVLRNVGRI